MTRTDHPTTIERHLARVGSYKGLRAASTSWDFGLQRALTKAEEHSRLILSAENSEQRSYHERMYRKWLGVAQGLGLINDIDKGKISPPHRGKAGVNNLPGCPDRDATACRCLCFGRSDSC